MTRHALQASAIALLLTALNGCVAVPAGQTDLSQAYSNAIYKAAVFDQRNVDAHPLLRLKPGLETVITWTTKATADKYYPIGPATVGVDVWVTVVPQVRDLCRDFPTDPNALRLRLQQLLGLPAVPEDRMFVTLQVPASILFRPCPDPDPSKAACTWNFPAAATTQYKAWFAEQMVSRYRVAPDGYPWTRLGYTSDWAPDGARSSVSEFVIPKGSAVEVINKLPSETYCHPPPS